MLELLKTVDELVVTPQIESILVEARDVLTQHLDYLTGLSKLTIPESLETPKNHIRPFEVAIDINRYIQYGILDGGAPHSSFHNIPEELKGQYDQFIKDASNAIINKMKYCVAYSLVNMFDGYGVIGLDYNVRKTATTLGEKLERMISRACDWALNSIIRNLNETNFIITESDGKVILEKVTIDQIVNQIINDVWYAQEGLYYLPSEDECDEQCNPFMDHLDAPIILQKLGLLIAKSVSSEVNPFVVLEDKLNKTKEIINEYLSGLPLATKSLEVHIGYWMMSHTLDAVLNLRDDDFRASQAIGLKEDYDGIDAESLAKYFISFFKDMARFAKESDAPWYVAKERKEFLSIPDEKLLEITGSIHMGEFRKNEIFMNSYVVD